MLEIHDNLNTRLTIIATIITVISAFIATQFGYEISIDYGVITVSFEAILITSLVLFSLTLVSHLAQYLLYLSFPEGDQSHYYIDKCSNFTLKLSLLDVIFFVFSLFFVLFVDLQEKHIILGFIIKTIPIFIFTFLLLRMIIKRR